MGWVYSHVKAEKDHLNRDTGGTGRGLAGVKESGGRSGIGQDWCLRGC